MCQKSQLNIIIKKQLPIPKDCLKQLRQFEQNQSKLIQLRGIVTFCSDAEYYRCHNHPAPEGFISLTGLPPCDLCHNAIQYGTSEDYQQLIALRTKLGINHSC